jgi:hypothetical protein
LEFEKCFDFDRDKLYQQKKRVKSPICPSPEEKTSGLGPGILDVKTPQFRLPAWSLLK